MGKFCGKCGKPMEYCTCSSGAAETVKAPVIKAPEAVAKMKYSTVARVDNIALGEGEKKVREYTLGRYPLGCGNVSLIITNKRVILKEFYELLILKHTRIEELNLESVHGISGTIGRGMNKVIFSFGVLLLAGSVITNVQLGRYAGGMPTVLLMVGILLMIVSLLFPYMTFSVIGMGSDHTSLATGINVQGKSLLGNGVLFQARSVEGAGESIAEAGACVFDLRTYGDEAMKKWARE